MTRKKTKGRQKIDIKKIESEEDRMITFSKRRQGIYKKLSELVTMCGAEVGFLTFSKAGTPFTYGHPSFQEVANRYMNGNQVAPKDNARLLMEAQRKTQVNVLNQQYTALMEELEDEQELEKTLDKFTNGTERKDGWWKIPICEISDVERLKQLQTTFQDLHNSLATTAIERMKSNNGAGPSFSNVVPPVISGQEINPFVHNHANHEANTSTFHPEQNFVGRKF